jgi:hypothetical protein
MPKYSGALHLLFNAQSSPTDIWVRCTALAPTILHTLQTL